MKTERHPFEPFLPEGARILFLGSFPPQPHRWCMPFYYPNWINDFWRIMGIIFFGDKEHFCIPGRKSFDEAAIREFCSRQGLAFYDTACEVRRLKDNASDAFLEVVTPTDIPALLRQIPHCHTVVTTGQKATEVMAATFSCDVPAVGGFIRVEIPDQVGNDGKEKVGNDGKDKVGNDGKDKVGNDGKDKVGNDGKGTVVKREVTFWRMPSTSRAYPLPLEKKAEAYRKLFEI